MLEVLVVGVIVTCAAARADDRPSTGLRHMLVINEDNSHFFSSRKPEEMTV